MSEPKIRLGQISPSSSGTDQLSGNVALAGNLTFSGTGLRILGDMSNATFSNRLTFQTSTANGFTTLQFAPNGTGTGSATRLFASSDIDNSAAAAIVAGGATSSMSFQSVITGSGTYMPMTFLTGGSERMRLDTSGNLGIGAAPSYTLDVNTASATFRVRDASGGNDFGIKSVAGPVSLAGSRANTAIGFMTNDTERMRIDSSGNVGIGGTAGANEKLTLTGTLPTSSNTSKAISVQATSPSGSTSDCYVFESYPATQAAAFTIGSVQHFRAVGVTIGASSAITNQYGFLASSNLTGATNNFGFYSNIPSGSNRWNFYANGTAANYFAGDTAIGTTTTPAKFTVQGAGTSTTVGGNIVSRFQTNGSGYDASIQLSDNVTNSAILSMLAGNISLISNGSNYFHIIASGYTGINTTSPASQLHVNSTSEWGIRLRYASDTTTNRATFLSQRARGTLASPTAATSGTIIGGIEGGGYTGAAYTSGYDGGAAIHFISEQNWAASNTSTFMAFLTNPIGSAGTSERMRITAAGNVGIGTNVPGTRLEAYVAGGGPIIRAASDATGGGAGNGFHIGLDGSAGAYLSQNENAPLYFYTNATEKMILTASGLLGIGTSSPATLLHISATASTSARIRINTSDSTGYTGLEFYASGSYAGFIGRSGSNNDISFWTSNSGTAPKAVLQDGGEFITGGTTDQGAYNLQCNGTGVWGAGAYTNGSDRRLKRNIKPLDAALEIVKNIKPVTFQYNKDYSKDQNVQPGFIAQDLQEAFNGTEYADGIVHQGKEFLNVAYQSLIPILTKAIQELKAELDAAKNEIEILKNK